MSVYDPQWKYRPLSETVQPGYLKRRFDEIRRQQREDAKAAQSVRQSKRAAK